MTAATELEFDPEEWSALTMPERARRCLLFAEQTKLLAACSSTDIKQAYLDLSRHWSALADEIESNTQESAPSERPSA